MIAIVVFAAIMTGLTVGLLCGFGVGMTRTREALKLARYREAIALADDLVKTPDALDLRARAQKLLADHRHASKDKES